MTVRVVVAVALAVTLLAVAAPGMQAARERAAVSAVDADADRLRAAVAEMAAAPRGSRRVVALSLPAATVGAARVAAVRVSTRSVRYRLASGRRGGRRLPAAVRTVGAGGDARGDSGDGAGDRAPGVLVFDSPGTYRVAVTATACGVRVVALGQANVGAVDGDAATADEGLNDEGRPGPACSTVAASVAVRRASRGTRSASTRATVATTATWRPRLGVGRPSSTRAATGR
ncbi:hypothetical protein [Halorubellus sp. PRR65]|uniref:DUF7311 family protein n=1 Tax=Halorubellus sp. PRR65 TaxID=3098148 RepID=UPI002B2569E8|nr:hypothetical protein [Halorubellus sp. PRR65]